MRWSGWVSVVSLLLALQAAGAYAACPTCGGNDMASYRAYCGPAGFSPPGYCLAPGCCECQPSACDNAWDGYCQEKAKWQAFFAQVGTPRAHCHGCPTMIPGESCDAAPTDKPPTGTPPAPVAKKTYSPGPHPAAVSQSAATSKSDSQWFH